MKRIWHNLFLKERSAISLSLFRMAVAFTVGAVVIPSFVHLEQNYFPGAFKTVNPNFFPIEFINFIQKSPEWLIVTFAWVLCLSCFAMVVGFLSQLSCIIMTLSCYYFYALNAYHVSTLSWDILLVTLFLMCMTPYPGDYFSVDTFRRGKLDAYKRLRPFFIQRLLQLQIGFTFFYTALYKTTVEGNWLHDNPLYYVMNYPPGWCYQDVYVTRFLNG